MDVKEFCRKLAARYTGSGEQRVEDIIEWANRNSLTNEQFNTLDMLVVENYGKQSFPLVKDLEDIYKKGYSVVGNNKNIIHSYGEKTEDIYYDQTFVNYVVSKEGLTLSQIMKRYQDIEKRKEKEEKVSCYENFYITIFSDMVRNYRIREKSEYVNSNQNQKKTQQELDDLLNGREVENELEPKPTKEELEEIKKLFSSPVFQKTKKYSHYSRN